MDRNSKTPQLVSWPDQFLRIFLPVIAIVFALIIGVWQSDISTARHAFRSIQDARLEFLKTSVSCSLQEVVFDLNILSEIRSLTRFLDNDSSLNKTDTAKDFLSYAKEKRIYDQIRFIGADGREVIRINYTNGSTQAVAEKDLQLKRDRSYFKEAIKLNEGEIFVSPMDLASENRQIEKPFKPVIRFAKPVFDSRHNKKGVLVLNYLGNHILQQLNFAYSVTPANVFLLNAQGDWLKGLDDSRKWGRAFPDRTYKPFELQFPGVWPKIVAQETVQLDHADGLITCKTIYPLKNVRKRVSAYSVTPANSSVSFEMADTYFWKIGTFVPRSHVRVYEWRILQKYILFILGVIVFSAVSIAYVTREVVKRRHAYIKLSYNERKFRMLFEKASEGIILHDKTGNILDANPKALDMLDFSQSDVSDYRITDIVFNAKTEGESANDKILQLKTTRFEEQLVRKDGSVFTADIVSQALEEGVSMKLIRNISARMQAQQALSKSEQRYALAQRAANIGSWDWDITTGELHWSDQIEPMFGFQKHAFDKTYGGFMACVHPDDRAAIVAAVDAAVYEKKDYSIEHRIIWPDGSVHWMMEDGDVFWDDEGVPRRMLGIVQDITPRKKAEEALKTLNEELEDRIRMRTQELESSNHELNIEIEQRIAIELQLNENKRLLQGVFDGITDPLILLDEEQCVKKLNAAALNYYRVKDAAEPINHPCFKGLMGKESACSGCQVITAITSAQEKIIERKNLHDPSKQEQIYLYPVKDERGMVEFTLIRIHDITERNLLERQLIQSEKMASIGVLVSGIAHEINNPNYFVSFNIPILRDYLDEVMPIVDQYVEKFPDVEICHMPYMEFREDIFKLLDNVEHGANRIKTIVSDLKEFSRQKKDKKIEQVEIRHVIDKVVSFTRNKIKKTVQHFDIHVPQEPFPVWVESQQLEQVLVNLLINAAQSYDNPDDEASRVALTVDTLFSDDTFFFIEVRDNGCGMDEKIMGKIFDPFFTTKPSQEGTGLGMYISHNLIESMGGWIDVESKFGKGSVFRVVLPKKA